MSPRFTPTKTGNVPVKIASILLMLIQFYFPSFSQSVILDPTFDSDGIVTTNLDQMSFGYAMALQADEKILVAGYALDGSSVNNFAISRYLPNGDLDFTFDADGYAITPIGGVDDYINAIVVQPDGKIVVGGNTSNGSDYDLAIVRYNSDGSLDLSFDTDGIATMALGTEDDEVNGIALQPDGKILVTGTFWNAGTPKLYVIRLNQDGSLDTSFDLDGIVITDFIGFGGYGFAVESAPGGKIIVCGYAQMGMTGADFAVVRYLETGALDSTFNDDGKATADIGIVDIAFAMTQQPDGKILLAGEAMISGTDYDIAVLRFDTCGFLDTASFGVNGISTVDFLNGLDIATSIALQPDNRIVVGGQTSQMSVNTNIVMARFTNDGILDPDFDTDGKVLTDLNSWDEPWDLVIQGDGKFLLAGFTFVSPAYETMVLRYMIDQGSQIDENVTEIQNEFNVSPNPSTGKFRISGINDGSLIQIFDANGKIVFEHAQNAGEVMADLTNQSKGAYFVKLTSKLKNESRTIILK